ncbi:MAG: hypothetical protein ACRDWD_12230 [Acidimicrobiia bacterium]
MRRFLLILCCAGALLVACDDGSTPAGSGGIAPSARGRAERGKPFEGLGTWVDAYDYAPAFHEDGGPPQVTPASVHDMAELGVKTLYLQATKNDVRSPEPIIDEDLVADFLVAAHDNDIEVVAWYLPLFGDLDTDYKHLKALDQFAADGERFDGIGLDIEWIEDVPDPVERGDRLVQLSERLRDLVGDDMPLAAIVFPAVQFEVINPSLWPEFPYRRLAAFYDVWMPMAYWTFRDGDYRNSYTYTEESIRRLRSNLGDQRARVHPIGGIADIATPADYGGFLEAVEDTDSIGWSVYDYDTTTSGSWPYLRGDAAVPPQVVPGDTDRSAVSVHGSWR